MSEALNASDMDLMVELGHKNSQMRDEIIALRRALAAADTRLAPDARQAAALAWDRGVDRVEAEIKGLLGGLDRHVYDRVIGAIGQVRFDNPHRGPGRHAA